MKMNSVSDIKNINQLQFEALTRSYLYLKQFIHDIITIGTKDIRVSYVYDHGGVLTSSIFDAFYCCDPDRPLCRIIDTCVGDIKIQCMDVITGIYISVDDINSHGKRRYKFFDNLFYYIIEDLYDDLTNEERCWCYMQGLYK